MFLNDVEPALFFKELVVKDEYSARICLTLSRDCCACIVVSLFDAAFSASDNDAAAVYLRPYYVDAGLKDEVVILISILEHVHHVLEPCAEVFLIVEEKKKREVFHCGVSAFFNASYLGSQRSV